MFNEIKEFFPTPPSLIREMLEGIDFKMINNVLEPQAGKGDLADAVLEKFKNAHSSYYNREATYDLDTIEINENLRHILQGKKYRVVHDDFLTFESYKSYDLIISNPPFSTGEKHLLKALDMQKDGGIVVCLLNAESLKNPYSNIRKDLLNKLDDYNADIKYISNAFINAENQTSVEIALVKVTIPKIEQSSVILDDLRKQEQHREEATYVNNSNVINADFIKGIIEQYNFEIKTGLRLIAEYDAIKPLMLNSFKDYNKSPILQLVVQDEDKDCTKGNSYIKKVRSKYWAALFTSEQFMGIFTSNLRSKYMDKISELRNYDFSAYNIYTIRIQINNEMVKGIEETILSLFNEFSYKSSWRDETSKNIHYFNGWKSNSAFKINNRVIIPLRGFNDYDGRIEFDYKVINKLTDTEKVFNYLDNGLTEDIDIKETLDFARKYEDTKKIQLKYYTVTFYKKGTCHIEFTNLELLKKFNLFGSQRKGWLPESYGKKAYKDMTKEEASVIDEFEGKDSYNNVLLNKDYYIVETSGLLMLA